MCRKCNYKVRELIKKLSQDEDDCFLQKALRSNNPRVQVLARSAMKAVMTDMSIDEFAKRLSKSLQDHNDMEADRRSAYEEFLNMIPFFQMDEKEAEYNEQVFGGLIE